MSLQLKGNSYFRNENMLEQGCHSKHRLVQNVITCIYEEPLKNVLAAKRKKFFQNEKFLEQGCYSKPELYKMILPVFINNLLQINTKSQQHV